MSDQDRFLESYRPDHPDPDGATEEDISRLSRDYRLAARHRNIVALDNRIAKMVQDVPVPAGLASRVRERLAAARDDVLPTLPQSESRPRGRRRWLVAGMTSLAAAIMIGVFTRPILTAHKTLELDRVVTEAIALLDSQELVVCAGGTTLPDSFDATLLAGCEKRNISGQAARVYRLEDQQDGSQAIVIIMSRDAVQRARIEFGQYHDSTVQVIVNVFPLDSSDDVCFLVVRREQDLGRFFARRSIT